MDVISSGDRLIQQLQCICNVPVFIIRKRHLQVRCSGGFCKPDAGLAGAFFHASSCVGPWNRRSTSLCFPGQQVLGVGSDILLHQYRDHCSTLCDTENGFWLQDLFAASATALACGDTPPILGPKLQVAHCMRLVQKGSPKKGWQKKSPVVCPHCGKEARPASGV